MTEVRSFERPEEFVSLARAYLMADEARHNLELGICSRLEVDPQTVGADTPYLAAAFANDRISGVAIRTPPFNMLISVTHAEVIADLAADAKHRFDSLPGVLSRPMEAAAFADAWRRLSGQKPVPGMAQRIYQVDVPPEIPFVPGAGRDASSEDRDILVRWLEEFTAEALPDAPKQDAGEIIDSRLSGESGGLVLWEDGDPVSFAGFGAFTPNGARIGPVYTLPQRRGRGYATGCVASISRRLLATGRRFCFLYADRSNPASNRLYLKLGYEPVCDMQEIRFVNGKP